MAFKLKRCAVNGCTLPAASPGNLCNKHRLPGHVVRNTESGSYFVITAWAAKRDHEEGVIFLNDFALGDLFGGRAGFEKKLQDQGFVEVRNISTSEELDSIIASPKQKPDWSGPWLTEYPWERN